jgi:hypothetical protein
METYHDKEVVEQPNLKNELLNAIEANLKKAEGEEEAMNDDEEVIRIKELEKGIEKEKNM